MPITGELRIEQDNFRHRLPLRNALRDCRRIYTADTITEHCQHLMPLLLNTVDPWTDIRVSPQSRWHERATGGLVCRNLYPGPILAESSAKPASWRPESGKSTPRTTWLESAPQMTSHELEPGIEHSLVNYSCIFIWHRAVARYLNPVAKGLRTPR